MIIVSSWLKDSLPALGPAAALLVLWRGNVATNRREERKRQLEWSATQLREFYAPLYALRLEILALSDLRLAVATTAQSAGDAIIAQFDRSSIPDTSYRLELAERMHRISEAYTVDIEYHNQQLQEILLPAYRRMQETFKERIAYADTLATDYFPILVKFNETWKRSEAILLPLEVAQKVNVSEAELYPFYKHLEERSRELKRALKDGSVHPTVSLRARIARALPWARKSLPSASLSFERRCHFCSAF